MTVKFYKRGVVFHVGDRLHIQFAEKPSIFEVVKVNKRKNLLEVRILEDYCPVEPYKVDSIVDIGKFIFKQYWFFAIEKKALGA